MLESMIAITIATIGIMGLLTLLSQALSLNRVITDQYAGSYLAAEGIEITKNLIDNNIKKGSAWNEGFAVGQCYEFDYETYDINEAQKLGSVCPDAGVTALKFDTLTGFYGYQGGETTRFFRMVQITPVGADEVKVNSIAKWTTRGGGEFSLNVEDHFFNWYP